MHARSRRMVPDEHVRPPLHPRSHANRSPGIPGRPRRRVCHHSTDEAGGPLRGVRAASGVVRLNPSSPAARNDFAATLGTRSGRSAADGGVRSGNPGSARVVRRREGHEVARPLREGVGLSRTGTRHPRSPARHPLSLRSRDETQGHMQAPLPGRPERCSPWHHKRPATQRDRAKTVVAQWPHCAGRSQDDAGGCPAASSASRISSGEIVVRSDFTYTNSAGTSSSSR